MKLLGINEFLLKGEIALRGSSFEKDEVFNRIEWLISEKLRKIAADESGWDTLYQDPKDDRFWELTYPHSEMHGGGPPQLKWISTKDAEKKYFDKKM